MIQSRSFHHCLSLLSIFLIGLFLYYPVLDEYFYADSYVLANATLKDLSRPFFAGAYYRPVIILSALIDTWLWNGSVVGFNLTNLLMHILNASLIYGIGLSLGWSPFPASITGLIFLLHPAGVDSTAWIAGRCDLFVTTWILLSVLVWIRTAPGWRQYSLIMSCLLLGMFSKESMVMGPFLLIGLVYILPVKLTRITLNGFHLAVFFFPIAISMVVRFLVIGDAACRISLDSHSALTGITLVHRIARYGLWLMGGGLRVNFLHINPSFPGWLPCVIVFGIASGFLLYCRWTRWGWFWCLLFIIPSLNIEESLRYLYTSSAGIAASIGTVFALLWSRPLKPCRWMVVTLSGILLGSLGLQSQNHIRAWALVRHEDAYVAKRLMQQLRDWPDHGQIFVYGLGQPVTDGNDVFFAKAAPHALKLMARNQTIRWLTDLSDYDDQHPLTIFHLKESVLQIDPDAEHRLRRFMQAVRAQPGEDIILSQRDALSGIENPCEGVYDLTADPFQRPWLKLTATMPDRPALRSNPRGAIYWRYAHDETWNDYQKILFPIRRNSQGIVNAMIHIGNLIAYRDDPVEQIKVEIPWQSDCTIANLMVAMTADSKSTPPLRFKGQVMVAE